MKMAVKTGFWDDASVWENAANVSTLQTATNINVSTTPIYSAPFTPATGMTITGLGYIPIGVWAGRTLTFTLQANNVDTMMSLTVNGNDVGIAQINYNRLPLNYIAAAGVPLRWKLVSTGNSQIAQSATAGAFAAITTELNMALPSNEFVVIPAVNQVSTTVTVRNTAATCGSNAAASGSGAFITSYRWWDMALQIAGGATAVANLVFDPTVNTALELKNNAWVSTNGKITQKPNTGIRSEANWNPGATIGLTGRVGIKFDTGSLIDIQGVGMTTPANWKSKAVSGLGTAASPLVLTSGTIGDWAVGDYLVFHPTGNGATNFNEVEYRYIISKPASNSVVLSNTAGGSENALVNTHAGGYVFNAFVGKNVVWKGLSNATYHINIANTSATPANSMIRWSQLRDLYSSVSSARGGLCPASGQPLFEYISMGDPGVTLTSQQIYYPPTHLLALNHTGLFAFNCNGASAGDGMIQVAGINKTLNDSWLIDGSTRGWTLSGSNHTLNKCGAIATGKGAVTGLYMGWAMNQCNAVQLNDCEAHACRYAGMLLYNGGVDNVAIRYISGTLGLNGTDAVTQGSGAPGYNTMYFESPTIAETNLMTNANIMLPGSKVTFNDVNGLAYNSYVFATDGVEQYTGAGLSDTTVSPLAYRTQRLAPINSTGYKFRYEQLANPNQIFTTYGRVWTNAAALADSGFSVTVDLYLPGVVEGVDTPSATVTMTKTATANSANAQYLLSAFYNGTRPLLATVVVTAKNTNNVASAYAYVGDILNGTNNITNQSTERKGVPSPIMFEQNGDANAVAAAVWSDTASYGAGSKGNFVSKKLLTLVKFLALK